MAGLGSRFRSAGYDKPKPLIDVLGKPMYAWAADSLPLASSTKLIFILLSSQPEFQILRADILERYAAFNPIVLDVPELTPGQAITVLVAKDHINNDEPLLIHNADTAFDVEPGWAATLIDQNADGGLLVFRSDEKRWSYSREDENGDVREVREKEVISPWASTGTYWFRRGSDFVSLAESRHTEGRKESGEYYVGPLYNELISKDGIVRNCVIKKLLCFGTPEDLKTTLEILSWKTA